MSIAETPTERTSRCLVTVYDLRQEGAEQRLTREAAAWGDSVELEILDENHVVIRYACASGRCREGGRTMSYDELLGTRVLLGGDMLLRELVRLLRRYVVLSEEQADLIALWVVHTHTFDAAEATPYLEIVSAEKRSGKTRLLEVLDTVVARPWLTGRVTSAVLARKIQAEQPTLLLDETDAAFKGDKEYSETLRGILNVGFRHGGSVSLCVGLLAQGIEPWRARDMVLGVPGEGGDDAEEF